MTVTVTVTVTIKFASDRHWISTLLPHSQTKAASVATFYLLPLPFTTAPSRWGGATVMALSGTASNAELGPTVIAVDDDVNSVYAVKWAIHNLLQKNSASTLIHVRTKNLHPHDVDSVPKEGRPPTEEESKQVFLPFREFFAQERITAKELVLHGNDVTSTLTDYIIEHSISNIVVGASHRNALTRKYKGLGVSNSLMRSVPECCTVHIISKGKVLNIQPTGFPQSISIIPTTSMEDSYYDPQGKSQPDHLHNLLPDTSDSEDINRKSFKHFWPGSGLDRVYIGENNDTVQVVTHESSEEANLSKVETHKSYDEDNLARLVVENTSPKDSSNQNSLSFTGDNSRMLSSQLAPLLPENQAVSVNSHGLWRASSNAKKGLSIEMRQLSLELKKTMEKYSSACREAIAAKQKVMELEQIMQEEERNLKHAEIRAMQEEEERKTESNMLTHDNIQCRKFDVKDIEVATRCFNSHLKIGDGGCGSVYKGVLDFTDVAIKVLRPDIDQGEKQFQQEVLILSTIRHPNIVLLLGTCPEYGCLVYEYLENGSLEDRLFQKNNTPPLPWGIRFKIAAEIATGLLFLHKTTPKPLVHRDLKPSNILLDGNYGSKISDVGLAHLVPPSIPDKTTEYHMTAAVGTFCYIDPEYQQTGLLGVKSDIYSLGIILLQILTAKPPIGLSLLVEQAIQEGTFQEVLDASVPDWPVEEALSCALLALKCCEMRKRDRPDLGSVILPMLNRLRDLGGAFGGDGLPASQVRERRWQPFKSIANLLSFNRNSEKPGLLPPTGKKHLGETKKDIYRGCFSLVSCSKHNRNLKKFHSFSSIE
ncbi:U-box domain-containing protein 51-like [Neltuma alba]|uniref:U-box domain-containing protein 51-like n=1 Tax=Neltuma alba TaxID=207710 RepID=UPI0010A3589F|nr:U-box domain-containing protein 51-like [Prosopis alba]